jgi:hypothetical protein
MLFFKFRSASKLSNNRTFELPRISSPIYSKNAEATYEALLQYGTDLTQMAADGKVRFACQLMAFNTN